jgi:hypothetical protein
MDARTFEPDEPLPRTCKHCKWSEMFARSLRCTHPKGRTVGMGVHKPFPPRTHPDDTCDEWEEKA